MKTKQTYNKVGELFLTSVPKLDSIRINKNIVTIFEAFALGNRTFCYYQLYFCLVIKPKADYDEIKKIVNSLKNRFGEKLNTQSFKKLTSITALLISRVI